MAPSQRSAEADMDDDDVLAGGSDGDSDEERPGIQEAGEEQASEEEEEADDDEEEEEGEEPEGIVDEEVEDLASSLSECTVEYNRQHSLVPKANKVRDHKRPHKVPTAEKLGEMKASNTTASRWPMANMIDPAAIVVLQGRIKEEDSNTHYVWYMRVVVEGQEDVADDKNALLPIPRGTTKDLLTLMAKDEQLCESSLLSTYMPTNYNEQKILPKVNGWEPLKTAPKTIAIKPKPAGQGGKSKADEREATVAGAASADDKKKAKTTPVPKEKASAAKPPALKEKVTPLSKVDGKKPVEKQPSVASGLKASKPNPANPFAKAKAAAAKGKSPSTAPGTEAEAETAPAVSDEMHIARQPTYEPAAAAAAAAAAASFEQPCKQRATTGLPSVSEETHVYADMTVDNTNTVTFLVPAHAKSAHASITFKF